jgi:hypothetical protein
MVVGRHLSSHTPRTTGWASPDLQTQRTHAPERTQSLPTCKGNPKTTTDDSNGWTQSQVTELLVCAPKP